MTCENFIWTTDFLYLNNMNLFQRTVKHYYEFLLSPILFKTETAPTTIKSV